MSPEMIGLLLMLVFLVVMLLGMPISFSMLLIGLVGVFIYTSPQVAFETVSQNLFKEFTNYNYIVVPMYIWMGYLAYESGIGTKFFKTANKWMGHLPGGMAMATQGASAVFGAICGSVLAATATIGSIAIPEMKKYNYDMKLATSSVACGGILGVLIPPSTVIMLYGIATQNSIKTLFKCSIIPGLILLCLNILVIYILVKRNPALAPKAEKSSWKERFKSLTGGLWQIVAIFIFSLGGLFAGWFTPTEAGSVGVFGVLLVTLLSGNLTWGAIKRSLYSTARSVAMILLLIAGAIIFGRFMALSNLPASLASTVSTLPLPPFVIMAVILLVYLILGCFIDIPALVLLTIPVSYPIVVNILGYNPIWFGVMMLMIQGMGVITPPVGMNVYVIKDIAKEVPLEDIFKGIWPFLIAIIVCIAILVAFPQIVTFLA